MPNIPSSWFAAVVVLAERSPFQNMGRNFRGERAKLDSSDLMTGLAMLTVVIVGIWLLSRLVSKQERRQPYNSPRKLFRALCRAHRLDRASRRLLLGLARHHRLQQPAELFVEAQHFEPTGLGPALEAQSVQLRALRNRLFAQSQPTSLPKVGKGPPGRRSRTR